MSNAGRPPMTDRMRGATRPDPYDTWDTLQAFIQEGRSARRGARCPYGEGQLYQRCAWYAGYNDANRGQSHEAERVAQELAGRARAVGHRRRGDYIGHPDGVAGTIGHARAAVD